MTTAAQGPSRPLRALAAVFGLWVVGRAAFVWSETEPAQSKMAGVPVAALVSTSRAEPPLRERLLSGIATNAMASPSSGFPANSFAASPKFIGATASRSGETILARSDPEISAGGHGETESFASAEASSPARSATPVATDTIVQPASPQRRPQSVVPTWTGSVWMAAQIGRAHV